MVNGTEATSYFGNEVVEKAVADYFARNGVTETVKQELLNMNDEEFFDMVDKFLLKKT